MEKIKPYSQYIIIGVVILMIGLGIVFKNEQPPEVHNPIILSEEEEVITYIYVDLKGEVRYPGVYKVQAETRLFQLVRQAGGMTSDADHHAVNLSMKLYDQSVVYIPSVEEEYPSVHDQTSEVSGVVNINQASLDLLQTLPGVGLVTAQAIIDYRVENGGFASIEEIMDVPGIGEATFEAIKELISIS